MLGSEHRRMSKTKFLPSVSKQKIDNEQLFSSVKTMQKACMHAGENPLTLHGPVPLQRSGNYDIKTDLD